jgi:pilus assembly protein CpaB
VKMTQRRMARPSLAGMLATRQGALAVALVCAACAVGIVIFALGQYRTTQNTPTVQATALVATAAIPQGTSANVVAARGLYKATPIVASQLVPGAVSDASVLAGKVATTNILPGQQLTLADFSGPTGVTGLLTPGQRALALNISESPGATDILQAGDRVDIYASFGPKIVLLDPNIEVVKPAGATASTSSGSAQPATPAPTSTASGSSSASSTTSGSGTSTPSAAPTPGTTLTGGSMVLAVTAQQASDLIFAAQNATLYLTLRPNNASPTPGGVTTLATVLRDSVAQVNSSQNGGH